MLFEKINTLVGERCVWWWGFREECLDWRGVSSWVDGWLKRCESRLVGFGWSEPHFESPMLLLGLPILSPAQLSDGGDYQIHLLDEELAHAIAELSKD